jgi:hemoglobin
VRTSVDGPDVNVFDAVGGRPFFDRLVEHFYEGVATDPVLRPLYPEDLTASIEHTAGFLAQYWGGGTAEYSDERGHPRLRMRHGHVAIGPAERDAWLHHMVAAVEASDAPPAIADRMVEYFTMASTHMINTDR